MRCGSLTESFSFSILLYFCKTTYVKTDMMWWSWNIVFYTLSDKPEGIPVWVQQQEKMENMKRLYIGDNWQMFNKSIIAIIHSVWSHTWLFGKQFLTANMLDMKQGRKLFRERERETERERGLEGKFFFSSLFFYAVPMASYLSEEHTCFSRWKIICLGNLKLISLQKLALVEVVFDN